MEVSEIRIKLVRNRGDRLKAFCSITFDNDFVVRDLKIIEGVGGYFVAMPSRKITDRCSACGMKNHLRAKFCNECGKRMNENRAKRGDERTKLHADVAHPINSQFRDIIQKRITEAYHQEVEKSKQPGYVSPRMDDLDVEYADDLSAGTDEFVSSADAPGSSVPSNPDSSVEKNRRDDESSKSSTDPSDFSEGIL